MRRLERWPSAVAASPVLAADNEAVRKSAKTLRSSSVILSAIAFASVKRELTAIGLSILVKVGIVKILSYVSLG
jgi:hypothetical protein